MIWYQWAWVVPALMSFLTLIMGMLKLRRAEIRLDAIRTNDVPHIVDRLDHVDTCLTAIERKLDEHIQYHLTARREG